MPLYKSIKFLDSHKNQAKLKQGREAKGIKISTLSSENLSQTS